MNSLLKLVGAVATTEVEMTNELVRVCKLPRRVVTDAEAKELADELTELLKTPQGTMKLWPTQAVALYEIGTVGGLLGPISVGQGKTLTSLLAPTMLDAKRPLLIIPASLGKKTTRDMKMLRMHWDVPEFYPVRTYEWLGTVGAADWLEKFQPDLIVMDEAHYYRNMQAARTRRIRRFFADHADVACVALSGTLTKRSIHDYAHIAAWCLAENSPLPRQWEDLAKWADAIDEHKGDDPPMRPGMLKALCVNEDGSLNQEELALWERDEVKAARITFGRRLAETPGVVASFSNDVDASLAIESVECPMAPVIEEHFKTLRGRWETPDGWPIADGLGMFRHSRELACGFFYAWEPRPPRSWLEPRKAWYKFVRETLKHSRKLDSKKQVALAYPEADELVAWQEVRDTFEPNVVPVWIDDSVVDFAAEWAEKERGIIWVEHRCVGSRLAEKHGLTYYGAQGKSASGRFIDDHPADEPMVASIKSNSQGRNLQKWSKNLVLGLPPNALGAEQLIGRTHRPGQQADEVSFQVLVTCLEHVTGFWQAVADAEYVKATTGAPQKLLLASKNVLTPQDIWGRRGSRWVK